MKGSGEIAYSKGYLYKMSPDMNMPDNSKEQHTWDYDSIFYEHFYRIKGRRK